MTIASLDDYIAANKNTVLFTKLTTRSTQGWEKWGSLFDIAGTPDAGVLATGNTVDGVVPDGSVTTGYIKVPQASGSSIHISKITYGSRTYPVRICLYDKVFSCGAYSGASTDTTLGTPPSFLSRMPNGNYIGTELWAEQVTNANTTFTCDVNYLDQDGNAGDTGWVGFTTPYASEWSRIPLAVGDNGISRITRVRQNTCTGTFNFAILRPLWKGTVYWNECNAWVGSQGNTAVFKVDDLLQTGLPKVYPTSALILMLGSLDTRYNSMCYPDVMIEFADK